MKEKIKQLMKSEGLSPSRLAEILEIQPSGVSHLVSGRNKPSYDLLTKIVEKFPNINAYWLLSDDSNMYRQEARLENHAASSSVDSQQDSTTPEVDLFTTQVSASAAANSQQRDTPIPPSVSSKIDFFSSSVKLVMLFYEDGSCESFKVR